MVTSVGNPVRLALAEDSPLFVELFQEIFMRDARLRIVGVAHDGQEAVRLVAQQRPDVCVMDLRMPKMDGLEAIEEIMATTPTPILVMTADPAAKTGELAFEALRRGALDLLPKPDDWADSLGRQRLCDHIVTLARVPVVAHPRVRRKPPAHSASMPASYAPPRSVPPPSGAPLPRPLIGIVSSTGGPSALVKLLGRLPEDYPGCVLVVQHLSQGFSPHFVSWLGQNIALPVYLAEDHGALTPSAVFIAPDGACMSVRNGRLVVEPDRMPAASSRPGDVLLGSLAALPQRPVGVVLTGMGDDGASGLLELRRRGGLTIAQDQETSAVYGMPRAAAERGAAGEVLPLLRIAKRLLELPTSPHGGASR